MATVTKTVTLNPLKYDVQDAQYSLSLDNMLTNASSNTNATVYLKTGSGGTTSIFLWFDTSAITEEVTSIVEVVARAKAKMSTTSGLYISSRTVSYYYDGSSQGSYNISTSATTNTAATVTDGLELSKLNDSYIQIYVKRGSFSTSTGRGIDVYGAELEVTYTYEEPDPPKINFESFDSFEISSDYDPTTRRIKYGQMHAHRTNMEAICNSDLDLDYIELREYAGTTPGTRENGTLLAVDTDGAPANTSFAFYFDFSDLYQAEGLCVVKVFGRSTEGMWSE